jgi:gamma-glutamylcyclotransferase (GGCT)/AIG2-like uncharacterized protein YtfP
MNRLPKCKHHKEKFVPKYPFQKFCLSDEECIKAFNEWVKEEKEKKKAKEWQKEKKEIKEKLMSKSDYLNLAQKVFNTYIRLRDKNKPCISCGKSLGKTYHAGHMFSVGAYPNLRFNENNVHGQCVECNLHKHGNVKEYDLRLQKVLSATEYQNLLLQRNEPLKLSIDEVKDLIKLYRNKIKEL